MSDGMMMIEFIGGPLDGQSRQIPAAGRGYRLPVSARTEVNPAEVIATLGIATHVYEHAGRLTKRGNTAFEYKGRQ